MQLQKVLDSLDGIPEDLHENYAKGNDDKFHLAILAGLVPEKDADTFDELRGALDKERRDLKALKEQNREFISSVEALGGIETLTELKKAQADAEKSNLEKKGEYDQLLVQVKDEHTAEIAKREAVIDKLRKRLDQEIRGRQVVEAITELEGNPHLLQTTVMQAARLIGDDDSAELDVHVYDPKTDIMLVDGEGKPLSVKGYVERLKSDEKYAAAFKGTGNSGGGAPTDGDGATGKPDGDGTGGGKPADLANFHRGKATHRERIDVLRKLQEQNGGDYSKAEEAYLNLPY